MVGRRDLTPEEAQEMLETEPRVEFCTRGSNDSISKFYIYEKGDQKPDPPTLEELGTPWAECYGGSGRLTGRLAKDPVYCSNGDVAPGWVHHGEKTEEEFYALFEEAQHDWCHTPGRADWSCPHCRAAGWTEYRYR